MGYDKLEDAEDVAMGRAANDPDNCYEVVKLADKEVWVVLCNGEICLR